MSERGESIQAIRAEGNMKALKKVGNFTGVEDIERWLDKFELAIDFDDLKDKEGQILPMHLEDAAYDSWENMPETDRRDPERVTEVLRSTFRLRRLDAWRSVLSKRLHIGDNIDSAWDQMKKLVMTSCRGKDPIECISGLVLLESLPTNVKDQVLMHVGNDISYTTVINSAKKLWPSNKVEMTTGCVGFRQINTDDDRRNKSSEKNFYDVIVANVWGTFEGTVEESVLIVVRGVM